MLGIRTTPLGTTNTLTTIPALANVGTGGGSIAHIATGNGWQTTFVLVNTGTTAAQANLSFFARQRRRRCSLPLGLYYGFVGQSSDRCGSVSDRAKRSAAVRSGADDWLGAAHYATGTSEGS